MIKETYDLSPHNDGSIIISQVGNWKITIVEYNGKNIGNFENKKDLKRGREFILSDSEKIFIKLKGIMRPKLEVSYNGALIICSSKTPENILNQSYYLALLIGIVNMVAGCFSVIF